MQAIYPEIDAASTASKIVVNAGQTKLPVRVTLRYSGTQLELSAPGIGAKDRQEIAERLNELSSSGSPTFEIIEGVLEIVKCQLESIASKQRSSQKSPSPPSATTSVERRKELSIFSGPTFEDRKSIFQAHVAAIQSKEDAMAVLDRLKENGKIARATHNIYAWRVLKDEGRQLEQHDCEDDGEHTAGSKLLHLLVMMQAGNLIVVVTRWYGGIHLGPIRFRHICNVAREVMLQNGFADPTRTST